MARKKSDVELHLTARNDASNEIQALQKELDDLRKSTAAADRITAAFTEQFDKLETEAKQNETQLNKTARAVERITKALANPDARQKIAVVDPDDQKNLQNRAKAMDVLAKKIEQTTAKLKEMQAEGVEGPDLSKVKQQLQDLQEASVKPYAQLNAALEKQLDSYVKKHQAAQAAIQRTTEKRQTAEQQQTEKLGQAAARNLEKETRLLGQIETARNKITDSYRKDVLNAKQVQRQNLKAKEATRKRLVQQKQIAEAVQAEADARARAAAIGKANALNAKKAAESAKRSDVLAQKLLKRQQQINDGTAQGNQLRAQSAAIARGVLPVGDKVVEQNKKIIGYANKRAALARQIAKSAEQRRQQAAVDSAKLAQERAAMAQLAAAYRKAGGTYLEWLELKRRTAGDINRATLAVRRYTEQQKRSAAATKRATAQGRTALSAYQRIRSEVIGLASAFVGLHGVMAGVNSVFETQNQLMAAQNRLAVGLGDSLAGEELEFAKAAAESLGLQIESVIEDYSKFVAATRDLGYAQQEIRDIFLGASKAIAVNKLSVADAKGVYRALTQVMSKNSVMSEELRQQLGDRLPGAVGQMAAALNVSTAELAKMMEQGEVSGDALIAFAAQLDEVYGSKIAQALESPRAKINAFQNQLFKLREKLAESGFIDQLTDQLEEFGEVLADPKTEASLRKLADLLVLLAKIALAVVQNIDTLVIALAGLGAVKAISGLAAVGSAVKAFATQFKAAGTAVARVGTIMRLLSGPVGLLVSALGAVGVYLYQNSEATKETTEATADYDATVEKARRRLGKYNKALDETVANIKKVQETNKQAEINAAESSIKFATQRIEKLQKNIQARSKRTGRMKRADTGFVVAAKAEIAQLQDERKDLEALRDQLNKEMERIQKGVAEPQPRPEREKLGAENKKQQDELVKQHEDYLKRKEERENQSLASQLQANRDASNERIHVINTETARMLQLIGQRDAEINRLQNLMAQNPEQDLSGPIKAQQEEIAELQARIDRLAEARLAAGDILAFEDADTIADNVNTAIDDIERRIKAARDRARQEGGVLDVAAFRSEFASIGQILRDQMSNVSGVAATAIDDALVLQKAAYNRFFEQVAKDAVATVKRTMEQSDLTGRARAQAYQQASQAAMGQLVGAPQGVQDTARRALDQAAYTDMTREFNEVLAQRRDLETALQLIEEGKREADPIMQENLQRNIENNDILLLQLRDMALEQGYLKLANDIDVYRSSLVSLTEEQKAMAAVFNPMVDGMANAMTQVVTGASSAKDAMRDFVNSSLQMLTQLIAKWAILNAIQAASNGPGVSFSSVATGKAGVAHSGGIAGQFTRTRTMPMAVFRTAPRYHDGGVAGIGPGEVPAVLQRGEEVLTRDDPRHVANQQAAGGEGSNLSVNNYNVFNDEDLADAVLNSPIADKQIINIMRRNSRAVKGALG